MSCLNRDGDTYAMVNSMLLSVSNGFNYYFQMNCLNDVWLKNAGQKFFGYGFIYPFLKKLYMKYWQIALKTINLIK